MKSSRLKKTTLFIVLSIFSSMCAWHSPILQQMSKGMQDPGPECKITIVKHANLNDLKYEKITEVFTIPPPSGRMPPGFCSERSALNYFKKEACEKGANVIHIRQESKPNLFQSCYRATADLLLMDAGSVETLVARNNEREKQRTAKKQEVVNSRHEQSLTFRPVDSLIFLMGGALNLHAEYQIALDNHFALALSPAIISGFGSWGYSLKPGILFHPFGNQLDGIYIGLYGGIYGGSYSNFYGSLYGGLSIDAIKNEKDYFFQTSAAIEAGWKFRLFQDNLINLGYGFEYLFKYQKTHQYVNFSIGVVW